MGHDMQNWSMLAYAHTHMLDGDRFAFSHETLCSNTSWHAFPSLGRRCPKLFHRRRFHRWAARGVRQSTKFAHGWVGQHHLPHHPDRHPIALWVRMKKVASKVQILFNKINFKGCDIHTNICQNSHVQTIIFKH